MYNQCTFRHCVIGFSAQPDLHPPPSHPPCFIHFLSFSLLFSTTSSILLISSPLPPSPCRDPEPPFMLPASAMAPVPATLPTSSNGTSRLHFRVPESPRVSDPFPSLLLLHSSSPPPPNSSLPSLSTPRTDVLLPRLIELEVTSSTGMEPEDYFLSHPTRSPLRDLEYRPLFICHYNLRLALIK